MNEDIITLQHMLDKGEYDSSKMNDILSHYKDYPAIIPCKVLAGSKIIRSSTNDNHLFHENVPRLSYPPQEYARTDRASLKGKPMFYASVFTSAAEQNNAYPRIISALETTDILRDYQQEGKAFTTQSLWVSDRDLHLFAFPFSNNYKKPCEEIKYQRRVWNEVLSKHWSNRFCFFSEYIGDLIAEENHSCLYDITANAIQYILTKSRVASEFDGIMYPSVWGGGQGMNICLKTETVDECIHFQAASVQCIDKHEGEATIFNVAESYLLPDGSLKWIPTESALSLLEKTYGLEELLKRGSLVIGNVDD